MLLSVALCGMLVVSFLFLRRFYHQQFSVRYCKTGHLEKESSECKRDVDYAALRVIGLGSDSHLAKGPVSKRFCLNLNELRAGSIKSSFGSVSATFQKVECVKYFNSASYECFVGEENDNIAILGIDRDCVQGIFFHGPRTSTFPL